MNLEFLSQINTKKVVLVVLFLAVCLGLGFGIYLLFFKPDVPGPGEPGYVPPGANLPSAGLDSGGTTGAGGELPQIGETEKTPEADFVAQGGKTLSFPLYDKIVSGASLSNDGLGVNFYNPEDSKFYTLSSDGQQLIPLSNKEFYQVEDVFWSNDKSKAIITYPDQSKILYDFTKNKQITLNSEVTDPDFSDTDQVAYKHVGAESDSNWLAVTDLRTSKISLIEPVGDNADAVQVAWSPTNQVVALYAKATGLNNSEIFFIGLQGENFKSLEVEGTNFKGLWSPNGSKILYQTITSQNNYNPILWITDAEGDNIGRHNFNLGLSTWVDKCVFADNLTIYCAVPKNLSSGVGLFEDLKPQTDDLIYKIDLKTGRNELVAEPILSGVDKFSISTMYLSVDNKFLFFWDEISQKIYRLQLK